MLSLLQQVAAYGTALYALGYMIVNGRLARYGASELDPVSARYVAAGLLFAAFLGGALVIKRMVRHELDHPERTRFPLWPRLPSSVRGFVVFIFVAQSAVTTALDVLAWLGVLNVLAFLGLDLLPVRWSRRGPKWEAGRGLLYASKIVVALPLLLFVVAVYAQALFTQVPTWIGGGKASIVRLELEGAADAACRCRDKVVYLVSQDGSRLVLVVVDRSTGTWRTVEVARSAVKAIAYESAPSLVPID